MRQCEPGRRHKTGAQGCAVTIQATKPAEPAGMGAAADAASDHQRAMLLCLAMGLDMDGDDGLADLRMQGSLDSVADAVRRADGHLSRHDEMEIDEGHAPGGAGADVMRLDRALGGFG